jgi:hypothetical protein
MQPPGEFIQEAGEENSEFVVETWAAWLQVVAAMWQLTALSCRRWVYDDFEHSTGVLHQLGTCPTSPQQPAQPVALKRWF